MRKAKLPILTVITVLLCLFAFGLVACSKSAPPREEEKNPPPTITLDKTSVSLDLHESVLVTATASNGGAIEWSSENANVATVENGLIESVADGVTSIIARSGEAEARCVVTVIDTMTAPRIILDNSAISIGKEQSFTVNASVVYKGSPVTEAHAVDYAYADGAAEDVITFASENGAATLTGVKYGKTRLTASTVLWGVPLVAALDITVCNTDITFDVKNLTPVKGGYGARFATVAREGYLTEITPDVTVLDKGEPVTGASIVWTSSDSDIATVDASTGKITAVKAGYAEIEGKYIMPDDDEVSLNISVAVVNVISGNVSYAPTLPHADDVIEIICGGNTITPDRDGNYIIELDVGEQTIYYTSKYYVPVTKTLNVSADTSEIAPVTFTSLQQGKSVALENGVVAPGKSFSVSSTVTADGYGYDNQPGFSLTIDGKTYVITVGVDNALEPNSDVYHRRSVDVGINDGSNFYHLYVGELNKQLIVGQPYNYELTYTNGEYIVNIDGWTCSFTENSEHGSDGVYPFNVPELADVFDNSLSRTIGIGAANLPAVYSEIKFSAETEGSDTMFPHSSKPIAGATAEAGKGFSVSATMTAYGYGCNNQPGFTVTTNGKTYLITAGVDSTDWHQSLDVGIFDGTNFYHCYVGELPAKIFVEQPYEYTLTYKNGKYAVTIDGKTLEFTRTTEHGHDGVYPFDTDALADLFADTYDKTIGIGAANMTAKINGAKFFKEPNVNVLFAGDKAAIDGANVAADNGFAVSATMTAAWYGYDNMPGFTVTTDGKTYLITAGVDNALEPDSDVYHRRSVDIGIYDGIDFYHLYVGELSERITANKAYTYKLEYSNGVYTITLNGREFSFDISANILKGADPANKATLNDLFDSSKAKTIGIGAAYAPATYTGVSFEEKVAERREVEFEVTGAGIEYKNGGYRSTLAVNIPQDNSAYVGSVTPSVTVKINGNIVSGATLTWTSGDSNIATVDSATGAITAVKSGTTTIEGEYVLTGGKKETLSISLTVVNVVTGTVGYTETLPHDGDEITVICDGVEAYVDQNGNYAIGIVSGQKTITFTSDYYVTLTKTVDIDPVNAVVVEQAVFTTLKAGKFLSVGTVTGDFVMKATVQAKEFNGGKMPAFGVEAGGKLFKVVVGANPAEGKGRWPFVRIYSEGIAEFCQADIDQVNDLSIDPDSDYEITVAFMGGKIFAQIANRFAIFEQSNIRHYLGWYENADHWEDGGALLNELFDASAQRKVGIATNLDDGLFKRVSLDTNTENVKKLFYIDNASGELAGKTFKYIDGAEVAANQDFTVFATVTAKDYGYDRQPGFSVTANNRTYYITAGVDNADSSNETDGKHRRSLEIGIYYGGTFYHLYVAELSKQIVADTPYTLALSYSDGTYVVTIDSQSFAIDMSKDILIGGDSADKAPLSDLFDVASVKKIGVAASGNAASFKDIKFVSGADANILLSNEKKSIDNATNVTGAFTVSAKVTATRLGYRYQPGFTITVGDKAYLLTVGVDDWAAHKDWELGIYDGENWYGKWFCNGGEAVLPNMEYLYELSFANGKYSVKAHDKYFEFDANTEFEKFGDSSVKYKLPAEMFDSSTPKTIGIAASGAPAIFKDITFSAS